MQALQLDHAALEARKATVLYLIDVVQEQMTEIRTAAEVLMERLDHDEVKGHLTDERADRP